MHTTQAVGRSDDAVLDIHSPGALTEGGQVLSRSHAARVRVLQNVVSSCTFEVGSCAVAVFNMLATVWAHLAESYC